VRVGSNVGRRVAARPPGTSTGARGRQRPGDPTVAAILSLQGSAGNSAVLQALAAGRAASGNLLQRDSSTVTFADPDIQSVYDVNKAGLSVSEAQQSGLGVLTEQYKTIGSAWSKLNWEDVARGAADRIFHPEHIDQATLGLCVRQRSRIILRPPAPASTRLR